MFPKNLFLMHLLIVVYYIFAWKAVIEISTSKVNDKVLKQIESLSSRYLTNWNFGLQTMLFIGYLCCDILELTGILKNLRNSLKRNLDFIFNSISAPISIFVAAVFWSLFLYDRELIFPKVIDKIMPSYINHALHSMIVVNVLVQTYINKTSIKNFKHSVFALIVFKLLYFVCLYGTYFEKKLWVYPFLQKFDEPLRLAVLIVLFIFSLVIGFIFHHANLMFCEYFRKQTSQQILRETKRRS